MKTLMVLCIVVMGARGYQDTECRVPKLENGWIEAQRGSSPSGFVGKFKCNPGFLLSGEERVKCRGGVWSQATLPVCTALQVTPSLLVCDPIPFPSLPTPIWRQ